jgi:hypothetical protein
MSSARSLEGPRLGDPVNSGATVPSGPARRRLGFGTILWALLPLLSLGLLAPVPFAVAAVRLRQRWLWVVTAGYAIGSALLIVGAFSPEGGWGEALSGTVLLLLMAGGTTHAFVLRRRVFVPSPTRIERGWTRWGTGCGGGPGRGPAAGGALDHVLGWRAVRVGFVGFPPTALGVEGTAGVVGVATGPVTGGVAAARTVQRTWC